MPTSFDELYEQLFGQTCTKEGEAFERLSAVLTAIISPNADVAHDRKLRGQFSRSLYQIDVLREEAGKKYFGEAKDYTNRANGGGKVGRGDLQKLGGALPDVGADGGVFYSASNYTREAKKYANAAQSIIGRPIELMHVRPSVEQDKAGRICKIVLTITFRTADFRRAKWVPLLTPEGEGTLLALREASGKEEQVLALKLERFVDASGVEKLTIPDLTKAGFGDDVMDDKARGCFVLPNHFMEIQGLLVEVRGLEYEIPYVAETTTMEIVSDGEPRILVKSENGAIDKLVTDRELQQFQFADDGSVKWKSSDT